MAGPLSPHLVFVLLAVIGVATPRASPALARELDEALPHCLVVFDRHNHKTGGSTMREIFRHQQASGRCFYWGYGPAPPFFEAMLKILENRGQPLGTGSGPLRLCVELHFRVPYWATAVPRIAQIRERARAAGSCRVVMVSRVREPMAFYLSFWRWTIMGKQLSYNECKRARAAGDPKSARMPHDLSCPEGEGAEVEAKLAQFGSSFLDWVRRTPNLQSRLLLYAGSSTCIESPLRRDPPPLFPGGRRTPCAEQAAAFGGAERELLFGALDAQDIVGTVESFDTHLLLLQDLTGWSTRDLAYIPVVPSYRYNPPHMGRRVLPSSHPMACANRSACVEAVRSAAPIDHELWQRYGPSFDGRARAALGGELAMRARLDELAAQRAALGAFVDGLNRALGNETGLHGHNSKLAYSHDTRARMSRERICRPAKIPMPVGEIAQPDASSTPSPVTTHRVAPLARIRDPQARAAFLRKLKAAIERGPAAGETECMPIPTKLLHQVQLNTAQQKPRIKFLPVVELQPPQTVQLARLIKWGAANPQLVRAVGGVVGLPECNFCHRN